MSDDRTPSSVTIFRHRVFLLADVRLYRDGLARALGESCEFEVVGSASVGDANLELLATMHPNIVLLEASAAMNAPVVQSILATVANVKVVAFAVADEEHEVIRCAEAGVAGYVSREASIDDLAATIVKVARGEFPCSARVAALLARRISSLVVQIAPSEPTLGLTGREREILGLIDHGLSNKEIAQCLGIGVSTVKNHVHHILGKTCASRRAQAAARLRRLWIPSVGRIGDATRL